VGDPGARFERRRDLGDRAVGNAQEDELRLAPLQADAALGEPRGERGADAPCADDVDCLDHGWLQFRIRIPGSD